MNDDHCQRLLAQPSVRLLGCHPEAALRLSFLYQAFRSTRTRAPQLAGHLMGRPADFLRLHHIEVAAANDDADDDGAGDSPVAVGPGKTLFATPPDHLVRLSNADPDPTAGRRLEAAIGAIQAHARRHRAA